MTLKNSGQEIMLERPQFVPKNFICLRERNESLKNGKRYGNKDFHLAIGGGLGWVKWLKNGLRQGFIFHAIIAALYPFWRKFLFTMFESQSCKNKIATKNLKSEKMVGFVKTFYHYRQKFSFYHIFSSPGKLLKDLNLKF